MTDAGFSPELAERIADYASFINAPRAQVEEALRQAWRGNPAPLHRLSVNVTTVWMQGPEAVEKEFMRRTDHAAGDAKRTAGTVLREGRVETPSEWSTPSQTLYEPPEPGVAPADTELVGYVRREPGRQVWNVRCHLCATEGVTGSGSGTELVTGPYYKEDDAGSALLLHAEHAHPYTPEPVPVYRRKQ